MYSNNLICDILEYINKNIYKEIDITSLSNIFYYDKTYIMKKFKKEIGVSIFDYINRMKIFNSLSLFQYDNYILNIALNNGFNSIEYYSEIFKKIVGVNPKKYRYFVNRSKYITDREIDIVIDSVNKLNRLDIFVKRYLERRRPTEKMVKVLGIKKIK